MYTFKTKTIEFESEGEIPWTLDGEFGGRHEYVKICNKKQALQIMIEPQNADEAFSEAEEQEDN